MNQHTIPGNVKPGMPVYGSDGELLGPIESIDATEKVSFTMSSGVAPAASLSPSTMRRATASIRVIACSATA